MSRTDLVVAGSCVVLTGDWLRVAAQAVKIAERHRQRNGVPVSRSYEMLRDALSEAMAASGHSDTERVPVLGTFSHDHPTVPIERVADQLGISVRTARRKADKLGGRKIGGRWFCDELAVREHCDGSRA